MSVTYGIDVQSADDIYITNAQKALSALNATGNVGTYLVDFIPLRRSSSCLWSAYLTRPLRSAVHTRLGSGDGLEARCTGVAGSNAADGVQAIRDSQSGNGMGFTVLCDVHLLITTLQRDGSARPSVLSALLEEYGDRMTPDTEYAIVSAAGTAYEGTHPN